MFYDKTMDIEARIGKRLEEIEAEGLRRELKNPRGIDLSSNDYLGLASDPRLKRAFIEGVGREGVGSTASRLLRGERDSFREVEETFAGWKGTEAALYFSSGYQANLGLLQTFAEEGDVVFSDRLNHASLIDGLRLSKCRTVIYDHLDAAGLEKLIAETECAGQRFLVTESLFSMDGDVAPLERYAELCRRTGTNLIVDEAHAVGIYGRTGSGLIEEAGIAKDVFLSVNTAGKALGAAGAFVAGSRRAIDYLINRSRSFIFSTAPLPAVAHALKEAVRIVRAEPERRERLRELCRSFGASLAERGLPVPARATQIVPVLIGDSERAVAVAARLQERGYDVRAIRPPTVPQGTARLRISLNAGLTEEILGEFAAELSRAFEGAARGEGAAR